MRPAIRAVLLAAVTALAIIPAAAAADNEAVTVSPGQMHGWAFYDDNTGGPGTGHMVAGPATPPLGEGSAELKLTGVNDRQFLATGAHAGTALGRIARLSYWTYQAYSATDVVNRRAITLQFDVHYNSGNCNPASPSCYQGRLVYEPGVGELNPPILSGWQSWDALAGHWWASNSGDFGSKNRCTQATPCTWAEVNANWPAATINVALLFKAGGGWSAFTGNVDAFTIGVAGKGMTTYDFEPNGGNGDDGASGDDQGNHDNHDNHEDLVASDD